MKNRPKIMRMFVVGCAVIATGSSAIGQGFVPLEWQRRVKSGPLAEQRKHVDWARDLNNNFVDDEIEMMSRDGTVNIFVQLNECQQREDVYKLLRDLGVLTTGRIRYASRVLAYVIVEDAPVSRMLGLASDPAVAAVEMVRTPDLTLDTTTRSIRVRDSVTYDYENIEDVYKLDGSGVNIAIIDSGVDDDGAGSSGTTHTGFSGRFVAGFDATEWNDADMNGIDDDCEGGGGVCEPADGSTNPDDTNGHGTHVAGIALGNGVSTTGCRSADDGSVPNDATGVAPGAGLVDVRWYPGDYGDVAIGLEWLAGSIGTAPAGGWAQVVNMSLGDNSVADGGDTITRLLNAVIADGLSIAVAMGNGGGNCVGSVAVSALSVGVASADDMVTVDRDNDEISEFSTFGPASGFVCGAASPDIAKLKPDLAAPGNGENSTSPHACTNVGGGTGICSVAKDSTTGYTNKHGTSMASPHVAGAMALLLEERPDLPPGALKDLLKVSSYETPDMVAQGAFCAATDARYNQNWGYGLLDVYNAVELMQEGVADLAFTACVGANPNYPDNRRCQISGGRHSYANDTDIVLGDPNPVAGEANTITVLVENRSAQTASGVVVSCGVYNYSAGMGPADSYDVGSKVIGSLGGMASTSVTFDWTPELGSHQCAIATIDYGLDTDFTNNHTQRNITNIAASSPARQEFRIQNPTGERATMFVNVERVGQHRWDYDLNVDKQFVMEATCCPIIAELTVVPPAGAPIGAIAQFDVTLEATTESNPERVELGGVAMLVEVVAPGLERAYTIASHQHEGEIPIRLNLSGRPTTDPRREIKEVRAVFKTPVKAADGSLDPHDVAISAVAGNVPHYTVGFEGSGQEGTELRIWFDEPLRDQERYKFVFGGLVDTDGDPLTGDDDFEVVILQGDANGSGIVTGTDISFVRGRMNEKVIFGDTARTDCNLTGTVTGTDISYVRARIGNGGPSIVQSESRAYPRATKMAD